MCVWVVAWAVSRNITVGLTSDRVIKRAQDDNSIKRRRAKFTTQLRFIFQTTIQAHTRKQASKITR